MISFKHYRSPSYRILSSIIAIVFSFNALAPANSFAQTIPLNLPVPGTMLTTTASFNPAIIMGINIHPEDPLKFDFIIEKGDANLQGEAFNNESNKLIKYFLAALTTPQEEMWVNLSPYERGRIIPDIFGRTEMGRDMLAQDYILKQLSASMLSPEQALGKEFWARFQTKAKAQFGSSDIPMDVFNKIWIVPQTASIYEHSKGAYIVNSHLKVMLEQDYLAMDMNRNSTTHGLGNVKASDLDKMQGVSAQIIREVLLPEIEKEVNEGTLFAPLRQMYHSMLLAKWYKDNLQQSLLGQVYVDKGKVDGINSDPKVNQQIYDAYLKAFEKGAYDYIKEDYDPVTQQVIPKKYFSGGIDGKITYKTDKGQIATDKDFALVTADIKDQNSNAPMTGQDQAMIAVLENGEYGSQAHQFLSEKGDIYFQLKKGNLIIAPARAWGDGPFGKNSILEDFKGDVQTISIKNAMIDRVIFYGNIIIYEAKRKDGSFVMEVNVMVDDKPEPKTIEELSEVLGFDLPTNSRWMDKDNPTIIHLKAPQTDTSPIVYAGNNSLSVKLPNGAELNLDLFKINNYFRVRKILSLFDISEATEEEVKLAIKPIAASNSFFVSASQEGAAYKLYYWADLYRDKNGYYLLMQAANDKVIGNKKIFLGKDNDQVSWMLPYVFATLRELDGTVETAQDAENLITNFLNNLRQRITREEAYPFIDDKLIRKLPPEIAYSLIYRLEYFGPGKSLVDEDVDKTSKESWNKERTINQILQNEDLVVETVYEKSAFEKRDVSPKGKKVLADLIKAGIFEEISSTEVKIFSPADLDGAQKLMKTMRKIRKNDDLKYIFDITDPKHNRLTYRVKKPSEDAAMMGMKEQPDQTMKGGIDFNPDMVTLDVQKEVNGLQMPIPSADQIEQFMNANGFVPIIINIAPVTNLPLLLGLTSEQKSEQISHLN